MLDIKAPCVRTVAVAFEGTYQADVREAEFGLVVLLGNLNNNVGACPLGRVDAGGTPQSGLSKPIACCKRSWSAW